MHGSAVVASQLPGELKPEKRWKMAADNDYAAIANEDSCFGLLSSVLVQSQAFICEQDCGPIAALGNVASRLRSVCDVHLSLGLSILH